MTYKKNIVIWGYCSNGIEVLEKIRNQSQYEFLGFVDNSCYKQGNYVGGKLIYTVNQICELKAKIDLSVIIATGKWREVEAECKKKGIVIQAIYMNGEIHLYPFPTFESLDYRKGIKFYAGDICDEIHRRDKNLYGLTLFSTDSKHIRHDIREEYPVPDNSIVAYEAEDVFEYVEPEKQLYAINEICRILKPHGYARFTLPDYNSPYLKRRTMCSANGDFLFDAMGGGTYGAQGIQEYGSTYFATYEDFNRTLEKTNFSRIDWLCYYTEDGILHKKYIDMNMGYVNRVSNETNENVYCLVVDCYK